MACIENVTLGKHTTSPIVVAMDKNESQELHRDMSKQCLSSLLKEDAEVWGHAHVPLRPSFNVLTPLTREQLELPSELAGACIPVDSSRALRQSYRPPPAAAEEYLATAEINSREGLAGRRQKDQDSINVSRDVSGSPLSLMEGGPRVSNGGVERGGHNARFYVTLPRGTGLFVRRGPQIRRPPHIPTLRSGIMMEVSPGNPRIACQGRLAQVSFPPGGPQHPVDRWQRPIPLSSSTPRLSPPRTAPCFAPFQFLSFNPFLTIPIAFAPPPIFAPPLPSYFAHFYSGGMLSASSSNREHN
ncbi:proline-rich protein 32 [Ochotona princeps]|uniref:proline-rich protein 32 n=1 Tax=Ochotona princeps TaxID=9978 RepID=UPI0027149EF8|nr:proline-rich protein 32 [Ochotona princeps]